jgi:hypothetical protein
VGSPPAWQLKGRVLIACNCDHGCPCNFNARPTHGQCEGGWTWHVEQGRHGDVALDGLNVSLMCWWPAAIHEGGGAGRYLIDAAADEAQRAALTRLLEGGEGGPWAIFRPTFIDYAGPEYVRYTIDEASELPFVEAGDAVRLETEFIRNPVTGETIHPRVGLPEGLVVKEAALIGSRTFKVHIGPIRYEHKGTYAAAGHFQYFG